jgi:hypothetical protein
VRATVGASQKTSGKKSDTQRSVCLLFSTDGRLQGSDCADCPAGLSMTCCHVAAVLHYIANTLALRQEASPTSVLCKWTAPSKESVSMTIDATEPRKHKFHRGEPKRRRSKARQWDTRPLKLRNPEESTTALRRIIHQMTRLHFLSGVSRSPLHYQFPGLSGDVHELIGLPVGTKFAKPVEDDIAMLTEMNAVAEDVKIKLQKLLEERKHTPRDQ